MAKHRHALKRVVRATSVAALLVLGAFVVHASWQGRLKLASRNTGVSLQEMATSAAWPAQATTDRKSARLVYQYSVVPGGVQDVHELSEAVAHDPDVALHYAALDISRAHLVRLAADRKMYVSYRRNGRILWTKTAHLIRAGEKVITDGKVTARTRCGNRLASKPEGLTAPDEPSEAQLNQPVAVAGDPMRPPTLLAEQRSALLPPLVANGPTGPGPVGVPILIGPPIGGGGGSTCETEAQEAAEHDHDKNEPICPHGHKPPPPVPEPTTYLLMVTGMLLVGHQLFAKRRRSETPAS